jgi:hypothetical protein
MIAKQPVNPLLVPVVSEVTDMVKMLLNEWIKVRAFILYGMGTSVRVVIMSSVDDVEFWSAKKLVEDYIYDLVKGPIHNVIYDYACAQDSRNSHTSPVLFESIREAMFAYMASYFEVSKWDLAGLDTFGVNPWDSCQKLWELGFVPSFEKGIWRLHQGPKGTIVYEIEG